MAVYCPMYDPMYGWYILVCGPNGFTKQLITSPLYYYYSLGVKPPIGSKFTQDDYDDFADDIEFNLTTPLSPLPEPSWLPISSPTMVPPLSQTTGTLVPVPVYSESNDFKSNSSTLQSASTPYLPSPSMTTGFKYKNNNVKPLTISHPFQLSKLSGTQHKYDCMPTSMPYAPQIPMSSALKFDNTDLNATSASSDTSYHLDYLPPTPSGVGKALPPIGTPCPHVASAATSSVKINENLMSPDIYDDHYLDEAMYLDGVDESLLYQEEEDYEMSEYF